MRVHILAALALAFASAMGGSAQTPANTIESHVAAARAAAGTNHVELFSQLCAGQHATARG